MTSRPAQSRRTLARLACDRRVCSRAAPAAPGGLQSPRRVRSRQVCRWSSPRAPDCVGQGHPSQAAQAVGVEGQRRLGDLASTFETRRRDAAQQFGNALHRQVVGLHLVRRQRPCIGRHHVAELHRQRARDAAGDVADQRSQFGARHVPQLRPHDLAGAAYRPATPSGAHDRPRAARDRTARDARRVRARRRAGRRLALVGGHRAAADDGDAGPAATMAPRSLATPSTNHSSVPPSLSKGSTASERGGAVSRGHAAQATTPTASTSRAAPTSAGQGCRGGLAAGSGPGAVTMAVAVAMPGVASR